MNEALVVEQALRARVNREFDQLPGLVESLIGALERFVPRAAARARAAADMERHPSFMERLKGEGAYEIGSHEYVKAQVARGILAWSQANQWEAVAALVKGPRRAYQSGSEFAAIEARTRGGGVDGNAGEEACGDREGGGIGAAPASEAADRDWRECRHSMINADGLRARSWVGE